MRTMITIVLCSMILLQGCSSYQLFKPDIGNSIIPTPDHSILVHTRSGREIEMEPYHFIVVDHPSNFYYGTGKRAEKDSSRYAEFRGKFLPIGKEADYIPCPSCPHTMSGYRYPVFRLADSSVLRAEEYFVVDSAMGTGLFYDAGRWQDAKYIYQTERLQLEEISHVEVPRFSITRTALFALGCAFIVAMGAAGAGLGDLNNINRGY